MAKARLMCPHCGTPGLKTVTDSRMSGPDIRRRRTCMACGESATTMEVVVGTTTRGRASRTEQARQHSYDARAKWTGYPNQLVTYP